MGKPTKPKSDGLFTESEEQQMYDVNRTALDDDRNSKSKKQNDITTTLNPVNIHVELPPTIIKKLEQYMIPTLEHRVIGNNEYLLLPKSRLKEVPKDKAFDAKTGKFHEDKTILDEILAIHGKHIYTKRLAHGDEDPEQYIAILINTANTPQYHDAGVKGLISHKHVSDLWEENLRLDEQRQNL